MVTRERLLGTVLIADDDALVRSALRIALTRAGYATVDASDSAQAVAIAASTEPNLIILDINMPGGTVHDTVMALRSRARHVPILVLSGEATPPDDIAVFACDFARKPIELEDLLARVERLLQHTEVRP